MLNRVLVVAAHPDDEILGCGGTLSRLVANGSEVKTFILATGLNSRNQDKNKNLENEIYLLKKTSKKANNILGVTDINFIDLPDNKMDSIPLLEIIKKVENEFIKFNPNLVLTHYPGDLNIDHTITSKVVSTIFRPLPNLPKPIILYFETVSSTEWSIDQTIIGNIFSPDIHINIEYFLEKKCQALACYETEMRPYPHSRSIENIRNLAKYRGASNGINSVESFKLGRAIF